MAGIGLPQAAFGLFLIALLAAISFVDIRERRIPDAANGLLFSGGVLYWWSVDARALAVQIAASAGVFAFLFAVRAVHMRLTSRTGLGLGDVKMAGACAVWFHPLLLPSFLLVSAGTAIIALVLRARGDRTILTAYRLPFAPFLSIGLLVAWTMELTS